MCDNMNMVVYSGRCHASFDWDVYIKMKRGEAKIASRPWHQQNGKTK